MISLFRKKKNLFIHIPKTGGSSFVGLLKESLNLSSSKMKIPSHLTTAVKNTEVSHVDFQSHQRCFKRPDIFEATNFNSLQKKYNIFMIVRNPIQRVVSEFNFQFNILNGKEGNNAAGIIMRLPVRPQNIIQYISNPHVQDYQTKFLLGRKLADSDPVTEDEFQTIIRAIDELPIHCGVTDQYADFLNTFQKVSKINLNTNVIVRKKTPSNMKVKVTAKIEKNIERLNAYDMKLYLYVKEKLNSTNSTNQFSFNETNDFTV